MGFGASGKFAGGQRHTNQVPPGGVDDHWSDVRALLSFDGNASDAKGHTFTLQSPAQVQSTLKKFGAGALQVSGGGSALSQSSSDFIFAADMCLEMFVAQTEVDPNGWNSLFVLGGFNDGVLVRNQPSGDAIYVNGRGINASGRLFPIDGVFRHFCVERYGTTVTAYVDGVPIYTITGVSGAINSSGSPFSLGSFNAASYMIGAIDEFRATAFARYRGPFTPPTEAFPRRGPA